MATVCTACCLPLDQSHAAPATATTTAAIELAQTDADAPGPAVPGLDAYAARAALSQWPFGGADPDTVRAVAEAAAEAARPQLTEAADRAAGGLRGELRIPNQRAAAFNPIRISTTPPPPNPYLAAERRQQRGFGAASAEDSA